MDSIGLNALQVGIGDQVVAIPGQLA
jgi:hypothetical protein